MFMLNYAFRADPEPKILQQIYYIWVTLNYQKSNLYNWNFHRWYMGPISISISKIIHIFALCVYFWHKRRHNVCCESDLTNHSNMRHHLTLSIKTLQNGLYYYPLCTISFNYPAYLWLNYMVIIRCCRLITHEFLKQICVLRPCCPKHNMHLW